MAESIFHALLPGLASLPPKKRKRGRPRKHFRPPKLGEGSGSLLSFEGWTVDRQGKLVAPTDRRKRGQRKVTSKYSKEDIEWLRGRIEQRQAEARKRGTTISARKALIEDMIEHCPTLIEDSIQYYLSTLPVPTVDPRLEITQRERAKRRQSVVTSEDVDADRRKRAELLAWKYVNKYVKRCQMILARKNRKARKTAG